MKITEKHKYFYSITLSLLIVLVIGKPIVNLYQKFIDDSIELCQNLEEENSEGKELEDDLEEKSKTHFLSKTSNVNSPISFYNITYNNLIPFYSHLYINDILQPPKKIIHIIFN